MPRNRDIAHTPSGQEGPQKVFVYGTLKRGYGNHFPHLGDARLLGIGAIPGIMFHLGGFPAICTAEHLGPLAGEVYETDWDHIVRMDVLEGVAHGNFYDRIQVKIPPYGPVWTYAFSEKTVGIRLQSQQLWAIPSGCWKGRETPSVRWLGFGKGVEVGTFVTNDIGNEIKIGKAPEGKLPLYILKREGDTWVLIHKETGEAVGVFKYLKDILGAGAGNKPTIRLKPDVTVIPSTNVAPVHPTVRDIMAGRRGYNPPLIQTTTPVIWTGNQLVDEPKEPEIPQAVRLLGLKYREA